MAKKKRVMQDKRGYATTSFPSKRTVDPPEAPPTVTAPTPAPEPAPEVEEPLPPAPSPESTPAIPDTADLLTRLVQRFRTLHPHKSQTKLTQMAVPITSPLMTERAIDPPAIPSLPSDLEQAILAATPTLEGAPVNESKERVLARWDVLYLTLHNLGFAPDDIQQSFTHTLATDLAPHLDWLCLHVPHERLPVLFYDASFAQEPVKISLTPHDPQLVDKQSVEEEKGDELIERQTPVVPDDHEAHKQRTLQAAQSYMYSDDEDEDIHQKHAQTKLALMDLEAQLPATKKNKKTKNKPVVMVSDETLEQIKRDIKRMQQTLTSLEQEWEFDPQQAKASLIKEQQILAELRHQEQEKKDDEQQQQRQENGKQQEETISQRVPSHTNNDNDEEDDDDDMFGFMDQMEQQQQDSPAPTVRWQVMDVSAPQWKGKTPKQLLNDLCTPKYTRLQHGTGIWQASVTIEISKSIQLPLSLAAATPLEAEHLVAVAALFEIDPQAPIYQIMAPPFKDLWLSWKRDKEEQDWAIKTAEARARIQFLLDTYPSLPTPKVQSPKTMATVASDTYRSDATQKRQRLFTTLQTRFKARLTSPAYLRMKEQRNGLPITDFKQDILTLVAQHQVIIISGETGCGKSTQVPQFLTEHLLSTGYGHVICTQPRRISAMSIAQRVSNEMGESRLGAMVGYQIRMESKSSDETALLFCTTGILLRRLESDPSLAGVTHIVVDEVHERSLDSDFLLLVLKQVCASRPDLRVVLMSATVNADRFSAYFDQCPILTVPGRTFPVDAHYLEDIVGATGYLLEEDSYYAVRKQKARTDQGQLTVSGQHGSSKQVHYDLYDSDSDDFYDSHSDTDRQTRKIIRRMDESKINYDLIMHLLDHLLSPANSISSTTDSSSSSTANTNTNTDANTVTNTEANTTKIPTEGALLIFLPGMAEIRKLYDQITSHRTLAANTVVVPLHSALSSSSSNEAFQPPPPNKRKIVLATNIAETGITIPDVTIVIDTGQAKIISYDQKKHMTRLRQMYVAKANIHQRKGRAGRVQSGVCFHLFTRTKYDSLAMYETPEILRLPLEELCLRIKACHLPGSLTEILNGCLDAPPSGLILTAIASLQKLQALDADEALTPLGMHLAHLPVDVHLGKMILYGSLFRCLDPILTIAAALAFKSPFVRPFGAEHEATIAHRRFFNQGESELMAIYRAYTTWHDEKTRLNNHRKKLHRFCHAHFLSPSHLDTIHTMKQQYLDLLVSSGFVVGRSPLKGVPPPIYDHNSASLPVIQAAIFAGMYPKLAMVSNQGYVQPDLPLLRLHPSSMVVTQKQFMVYNSVIMNQETAMLGQVTPVDPITVLLLASTMIIHHSQKSVLVDSWIQMHCVARTAVLIQSLRQAINRWMSDKMIDPTLDLTTATENILTLMVRTLESNVVS